MNHLPQRILMTADAIGGVWTYALELARGLQGHGVEIALATMGAPLTRHQRQEVSLLSNVTVYESTYKLEWMERPWKDVAAAGEWLLELEKMVAPDLVHLNGYAHGALSWRTPLVVVGHSCVFSWWRAVHRQSAPPAWDRYRHAVTAGLGAADVVVAPSHSMLALLKEFYGPLPPSAVIPNGRTAPSFEAKPKEQFVFAAGRIWDAAKNISALEAIAPSLPWPVVVAGDTDGRAAQPEGASAVRHLGRLSSAEMWSWMSRASIFAAPARYEPFGLCALEAGLAGCALLLGDIPSLRELWEGAALFVAPDSIGSLRDTLQELMSNPSLLAQCSREAREAAARFTTERMIGAYLRAYSRCLESRNSLNAGRAPGARSLPHSFNSAANIADAVA